MKRYSIPLPITVSPPSTMARFARSRAGAFVLGFFSAGFVAGILSGLLRWPN